MSRLVFELRGPGKGSKHGTPRRARHGASLGPAGRRRVPEQRRLISSNGGAKPGGTVGIAHREDDDAVIIRRHLQRCVRVDPRRFQERTVEDQSRAVPGVFAGCFTRSPPRPRTLHFSFAPANSCGAGASGARLGRSPAAGQKLFGHAGVDADGRVHRRRCALPWPRGCAAPTK